MAIEAETENGNTNWTAVMFKSSVYILWGLIAGFAICVCCMYSNIYISIKVLKTAAIVIVRNFYVLLVPFLAQLCIMTWAGLWIFNFMYLISTASITQPKAGS